jgi:hypothetical protein
MASFINFSDNINFQSSILSDMEVKQGIALHTIYIFFTFQLLLRFINVLQAGKAI